MYTKNYQNPPQQRVWENSLFQNPHQDEPEDAKTFKSGKRKQ